MTCSTEAINSKVEYSPFDVKFSNVQSGSFDLCDDSKTNASSRHHEEFPVTVSSTCCYFLAKILRGLLGRSGH